MQFFCEYAAKVLMKAFAINTAGRNILAAGIDRQRIQLIEQNPVCQIIYQQTHPFYQYPKHYFDSIYLAMRLRR